MRDVLLAFPEIDDATFMRMFSQKYSYFMHPHYKRQTEHFFNSLRISNMQVFAKRLLSAVALFIIHSTSVGQRIWVQAMPLLTAHAPL